jgi:hypothetical protein
MSQTPVKRQTFAGSAEDVAAVIGLHAVVADFLEYPEKIADKININKLWKVKSMWFALHKLNDNWSIQSTKLTKAMTLVWEEKHDTWPKKLVDAHKDAWILAMTKRLRTALAHLSKALARGRARTALPRWLAKILTDPDLLSGDSAPPDSADSATQPGEEEAEEEEGEEQEGEEEEEEGEEPDEEEEEDPEKQVIQAKKKDDRRPPDEPSVDPRHVGESAGDAVAQAVEYVYGYCFERSQAWRTPANSKAKIREYTKVYAKEGAQDKDYVFCKWGEHEERKVVEMTVLEFKTLSQCLWQTTKGSLWNGKLGKSVLRLTKSCRKSVESLVINKFPPAGKGKGTQLLQILVGHFTGKDMHDNREQAVKLGMLICEQLSNGDLEDDPPAIRAVRDNHMAKQTAKRPAGHEEMTAKRPAGLYTKKEKTNGTEAGKKHGATKGLRKKPASKGQEADEEEEEEEAQDKEEEEAQEEEEEADEAEEKQTPAPKKKPAQKRPAGKDNPLPVHNTPAGNPPAKRQKQDEEKAMVNEAMELARRELDDHPPPSGLLEFGNLYDDGSRPAEAAPQR